MKKQVKNQVRLQLIWVFFFSTISFGVHGQVQIGDDIDGRQLRDHLGNDVSLSSDGRVLAIGVAQSAFAPKGRIGYVQVYEKIVDAQSQGGFKWEQIGEDIYGVAEFDWFGQELSLSSDGSVLAIGAWGNDGKNGDRDRIGLVRVYERDGSVTPGWKQVGEDIYGEAQGDESGSSVSLSPDGRVLAIGSPVNNGNGKHSGHVRVYERDDNLDFGWRQLGKNIDGEAAGDFSGSSLSLSYDGSVLAIGTRGNDGNGGQDSGHVRMYERDDNLDLGWRQVGKDIDGDTPGDQLGHSVSLSFDGRVLAIGAPDPYDHRFNTNPGPGYVRVYERDDNIDLGWRQLGGDIVGEANRDESGQSVSLSSGGRVLAIGGWYNDGFANAAGHVRVYERDAGSTDAPVGWRQVGKDIEGEASEDGFGHRVSLSSSGSFLAIGTWANNANNNWNSDNGHVRVYRTGASVSIEAPMQVKATASFEVTFTFDMDVTGFELGDIQVTNATVDNFTTVDDSTYTATIASTSLCGNIAINVPAGSVLDALNMPNLSAQEVIVVTEDVPPNAIAKDITVALGANGQVIIKADQINNGSTDNCGVAAMFIGSNQVISSEGIFDVELIVEDVSRNRSSAFAKVTVEAPPTVSISNAPSVVKDLEPFTVGIVFSKAVTGFELGDIQVTNATVSTLTGSGSTYTATLEPTSSCDDITIDIPANMASVANSSLNLPNLAATQVSIGTEDTIDPTITCPADVVASTADNGTGDCTTTVDLGSPVTEDNCSVAAVVAQVNGTEIDPDTYEFSTGATTVTWIVSDGTGNTASCEQIVTVHDDEGPMAICQDITVQLDADGNAAITANEINNDSDDNCGVRSLTIDRDTFDCSDIGVNTVELTVTDINGNTATCSATVTVEANLENLVAVARDITVQLDASGQVTISPEKVDDGSSYGCNNAPNLSLDRDTFTCDDVGTPVTVTLTAAHGTNTARTTALVTVEAAGNCKSAAFTIDAIADVTLPENTIYTSVTPVLSGNPKGAVTWTLGGTDAEDFSIDSSTGVVTMIARDFEAPADANADNVYEVSITATDSENNSSGETSWTVTVLEDALATSSSPVIPTAFTPNGDGANDTWIIDDLSEDASVKIYDRHGTIIFSSNDGYIHPWDGTSRGKSLPAGSYLYAIQDGPNTYKGAVTILL